RPPSTWPLALPMMKPMTFPMSWGPAALVAAKASSIRASTPPASSRAGAEGLVVRGVHRAGVEPGGRVGLEHHALGLFLLDELGPAGRRERLDRLGPLLDLLAGDLTHLVVAQLVADVLLTVGDRRGQHPE